MVDRLIRAISAVVLGFACSPPGEPIPENPAPSWVYEPRLPAWQLGELKGRFGRSQAPQRAYAVGITGEVRVPLRLPTPWPVPGAGPARAVVHGLEGIVPAVELVDIDAGKLVWRETATCKGAIVGVTATAIVCADEQGTRSLGLDGKPGWKTDQPYVAMTDDRVVVAGDREAIILAAGDGSERARVKLPPAVGVQSIVASCDRELFALGPDGKLVRIAEVAGKPAATWAVPVGEVTDLDPCTGESIVVASGSSLLAIARTTGKLTGRIEGVRGHWRARDDEARLEVATAAGVSSWSRDLVGPPAMQALPPLGELLDERGDRRLVRASALTAVLLDATGVHSYFPFAAMGAVLGETSLLGASWVGSPGEAVRRIALPERTRRVLRVPHRAGVMVPAELRDLPVPLALDLATAIAKPDTGRHAVAAFALDPHEPAVLYAVALERAADDSTTAVLASADLATRTWRWQRGDGCGPGTPVGVAIAGDVIACASRGVTAMVRATSRDGAARWQWEGDRDGAYSVDAIHGAGDWLLVHDADRLVVLDAATGRVHGRFASEDGAAMRATVVVVDATPWLVTFEHGRLVARLPGVGMLAAWSLRVDGVVRGLSPSGDGVLVELDDGDAYRVTLRTAAVTPFPGLGLTWHAAGEVVTGHTVGGPIPGVARPAPPRPRPALGRPLRPPPAPANDRNPDPPSLWTPIPPPPSVGESWQYTLYELTGGLRARNDYALAAPIASTTVRGPPGSPLVVAYGARLREVIVLDPRNGNPLRRVQLPDAAAPGLVFGTIVDGTPVAGALLAAPLRVVLF